MHAVEKLDTLTICTSSLLAAAQADHMLSKCSPKHLDCTHGYVPTIFPLSLRKLSIQLDEWTQLEGTESSMEQAVGGLLYRMRDQTSLVTLELFLGESSVVAAPICLPHLENLCVDFTLVDDNNVDLSWLQSQPADYLCLEITIKAQHPSQQIWLVRQLQLLDIHYLCFKLEAVVSERVQQQWARLELVHDLLLDFPPSQMHISELPPSNCTYICGSSAGTDLPSVSISWSAVCASVDKTSITPRRAGTPTQNIHIIGSPGYLPARAQPWVLEVEQPDYLIGLPESLYSQKADKHGRYKMRTAAAVEQSSAAGS